MEERKEREERAKENGEKKEGEKQEHFTVSLHCSGRFLVPQKAIFG